MLLKGEEGGVQTPASASTPAPANVEAPAAQPQLSVVEALDGLVAGCSRPPTVCLSFTSSERKPEIDAALRRPVSNDLVTTLDVHARALVYPIPGLHQMCAAAYCLYGMRRIC